MVNPGAKGIGSLLFLYGSNTVSQMDTLPHEIMPTTHANIARQIISGFILIKMDT
jgi:hypothetical protein